LKNNGVIVLQNSHTLLHSGSQTIILAGTDDPNGPADMIRPREFVQSVRDAEGDGFFIMLEHRNRNLQLYSEIGVDLVLSGHSHGGIIRLPFTDGLIDSRLGFFPEHASGVNTIGETNMVVSRGLGSWILWLRLFNNPEVVVVELRNSDARSNTYDTIRRL
jgi:predicted MPP superfamily phosphohydrolase